MKGWREAISKTTGATFAARITPKRQRGEAQLKAVREEIRIMRCLKSRYVLSLVADFEDDERIIVVTELLPGGGLFNRIVTREFFSEREARECVRQVLIALEFMHGHGIVHRRLQPENIQCSQQSETDSDDGWSDDDDDNNKAGSVPTLKISDFSYARMVQGTASITGMCGAPGYVAPEILRGEAYGAPVDVWAVGVITYVLLCGYPPFFHDNVAAMHQLIISAEYEFDPTYWGDISEAAQAFIRRMLCASPTRRASARALAANAGLKSTILA